MKIYSVHADHDKYDACIINFEACAKEHPNLTNYEMMFMLDGRSVASEWWPRKMERYNELPLADYISKLSGDVLIMRREAIEKLRPLFGNIEVLPIDCDFGDYWAVNVMDVLDCIDYDMSEFKRFAQKDPNVLPRIMIFRKFAFRPEQIRGHHVFKIIDQPKSHIFVDEVFMEEIEKQNITGFKCKLVWEG